MGKAPILAAAGLAICMLIAACGSESELTKAAFIKQADAICASAYRQAVKDKQGDLTTKLAGMLNDEADEIDDLNGPGSDTDQIGAILDSTRTAADAIEASKGEPATNTDPSIEKAERLASAYGLKSCPIA